MKIEDYQLSNGTILIRPYQMNDVEACFEATVELMDELMPWMFWCNADIAFPEIEKWVESRPGACLPSEQDGRTGLLDQNISDP